MQCFMSHYLLSWLPDADSARKPLTLVRKPDPVHEFIHELYRTANTIRIPDLRPTAYIQFYTYIRIMTVFVPFCRYTTATPKPACLPPAPHLLVGFDVSSAVVGHVGHADNVAVEPPVGQRLQ